MHTSHLSRPLSVHPIGDAVIAVFPAEVDLANGAAITEQLLALLNGGADPLILDLTATGHCASAGVNAIARAFVLARALKVRLALAVPPQTVVHRVLVICGLPRAIPTLPTVAEAMCAVSRP